MGSKVSKVNSDSTTSKDTYQGEVALQGEPAGTTSSDDGELHQGIISMTPARLSELLYGLQVIAKLQRDTTEAQIESREKRREAMQNREDVWFWDDKLIREIQKLVDEGKLHAFEDLMQVVNKCHAARDRVGPLEQEVIETERKLESQFWKLQQAEEKLNIEFKHEFHQEGHYPEPTTSRATSSYRDSYESGNDEVQDAFMPHEENIALKAATFSVVSSSSFPRILPQIETSAQDNEMVSKETLLSDLIHDDAREKMERGNLEWQSEIQGIDEILNDTLPAISLGPRRPLPFSSYTSLEQYPKLLTDFQTGRERINKWIQNTALASRSEATSLFTGLQVQLSAENQPVPSNWAQLVTAFWWLDEAAVPKPPILIENEEQERRHNRTAGGTMHPGATTIIEPYPEVLSPSPRFPMSSDEDWRDSDSLSSKLNVSTTTSITSSKPKMFPRWISPLVIQSPAVPFQRDGPPAQAEPP